MPGGDGTGPVGLGSMTGRAAGYCAGYPVPGYANPIPGRGWFGRGRGWRHWYWATGLPGWARLGYNLPAFGRWRYPYWPYPYWPEITPKEEMDMLKTQAESLKQELEDIQSRISTLEKAQQEEQAEKNE